MNAEILSIGDELLIGQVTNTNAVYLGEQLSLLGITVRRITTVGDRLDDSLRAFTRAWDEVDVVIVTGGLGPTHDDLTRAAVCEFFGCGLVENAEVRADVVRFLAERNRQPSPSNLDQAMVPDGAAIIRNTEGTAPGYHFSRDGRQMFVLPGVPYEMHAMMEHAVLPRLREGFRTARVALTVLTTGIPESTLADALHGIETLHDSCAVAYLPSPTGVRVRLTAVTARTEDAARRIQDLRAFVLRHAGEYVYGYDHDRLEDVVVRLLRDRGMTIAVAESCTGGAITDRLTNVPGSSACFERGMITYSNRAKTELLGVDPAILSAHGAVSAETAAAMADGARRAAGVSIGLATTGVAGPSGGSPEKPVGLVWIGFSGDAGTHVFPYHFGNDRVRTKQRAAQAALDTVRRALLGLPLHPSTDRIPS